MTAFFYTDDGLVVSPHPERLQREFYDLTDLFGRSGLRTNVQKKVSMDFQPCYIPGGLSESEYMRRFTGSGASYLERLWWRVDCPECRVGQLEGSLLKHIQGRHDIG